MRPRDVDQLLIAPDITDLIRSQSRLAAFRTAAAPRPPHPFMTMRWYPRYIGRVPGTTWGGVVQYINLKQEGYTSGLLIRVSGVYDIAVGGSTLRGRAPYLAINKFQINPPGGANPWNINGWNTKMFNLYDRDWAPFVRGFQHMVRPTYTNGVTRNATTDEAFPNAANVAGQAYSLWFFIPFHRSASDLRGILPTGTDDQYQLAVYPGAVGDVFTTAANVANTTMLVDVWQVIHEPPIDGSLNLDQRWLYTTEEKRNPNGVPAVGDYEVIVPKRRSIITDILHTIVFNDAQDSADINTLTFSLDGYQVLNAFSRLAWDMIVAGKWGATPPLGVIHYPWDALKEIDGSLAQFDSYFALSMAEWLDTKDIATVSSLVNISGGIAGATNHIDTAVRRLNRVA